MPTKTIALEAVYPQAVAEQWGTRETAEAAGVGNQTAARFLQSKAAQIEKVSSKLVLRVSRHAGALFTGAAQRQLRRLEQLESLPDDEWTRADLYLEKHAIALLKPLSEWCKLRMDASPDDPAGDPPQLSDGL